MRKSYIDHFRVDLAELLLEEEHISLFGCSDLVYHFGLDSVLQGLQLERLIYKPDQFLQRPLDSFAVVRLYPVLPLCLVNVQSCL